MPAPKRFQRQFAGQAGSISEARHWIRQAMEDLAIAGRTDDVVLIVSELVTNAILYGEGGVRLTMAIQPDRLYLSVADAGAGGVEKLAFSLTAEHGRGLRIVEALSDRWGVEWRPGADTVVWAEFDLSEAHRR